MNDIKIFLQKKKKKSEIKVVNVIKIYQKMRRINWLSIKRNIEGEKMVYYNYEKLF